MPTVVQEFVPGVSAPSCQASGQASLLQNHDKWIIGFGLTDKSEAIETKLLSNNLTSGNVAHLLVPTHNILQRSDVGELIVEEKLFPGYFFLGVTTEAPSWWEMQAGVEEIFSILTQTSGVGRTAAFLRDSEKEHIAQMMQEVPQHVALKTFSVGDRVMVTEGSFKNLGGTIVEMRGRDHAKVEIEVRSKIIPAVFSLFSLKPQRKKPDK